jgi:hypothetical protein
MKKWVIAFLTILLSTNALVCSDGYSQTPGGAPGLAEDIAGVDELARILVEKGVLRKEDLAAMQKKRAEGQLTSLDALTELLKSKGVLSAEEANRVSKKQAEEALAKGKPVILYSEKPDQKALEKMAEDVTREIRKDVQARVKAEVKEEVMKETKAEIKAAAAPEWTKRIRFGGDVRLRYEGAFFDENNALFVKPSDPTQLLNTTEDRHRFQVRARLGATAEVNEIAEIGLRLSTGSVNNPVSTNQTMGNYFNNYSIYFDRAYLRVEPVPSLNLWGGRIPNPWFYSDLVWDHDVAFDGVAAVYNRRFSPMLEGFAIIGAFPLQEIEFSQQDKWLFGGQVGLGYKPSKELSAKIGLAYYDYQNTQGIPNDPSRPNYYDWTAPNFQQKGNTLFDIDPSAGLKLALASEYKILNLTGTLDIGFWDPIRVVLLGDYVNNIGFSESDVSSLTGNPNVKRATQGFQAGISVGHASVASFGKWRAFLNYKYLEADAVMDAFTDSDFHIGGTNARGWILGAEFGLLRNIWVTARWMSSNEIDGPPLAVDRFFLDLQGKF